MIDDACVVDVISSCILKVVFSANSIHFDSIEKQHANYTSAMCRGRVKCTTGLRLFDNGQLRGKQRAGSSQLDVPEGSWSMGSGRKPVIRWASTTLSGSSLEAPRSQTVQRQQLVIDVNIPKARKTTQPSRAGQFFWGQFQIRPFWTVADSMAP